jgi:hypothetical protein
MRTQLVAARTVAESLADMASERDWSGASGSAGTQVPEIAGPREESMVDMATLLITRRGDPIKIEGASDPSDPEHLGETGRLLPGPHAKLAGPTFEEWLSSTT